MKRISIVLIFILLLSVGIANAGVGKGFDKFTESVTINSNVYGNPHDLRALTFSKILNKNKLIYEIVMENDTYEKFILASHSLIMRVNDDNITLPVKDYRTSTPIDNKINTTLTLDVPNEFIEKIKNANRVALKFTRNDGSTFVYVLPNNILAEWKEVITTEE